jgi:hypothetical protein
MLRQPAQFLQTSPVLDLGRRPPILDMQGRSQVVVADGQFMAVVGYGRVFPRLRCSIASGLSALR